MVCADARGDSFGLSRLAAERHDADYVVFCGVHFMAESADILTGAHQQVILPDLNAGCSMADMADIDAVEEAWEALADVTDVERIVPITYMNSSAALKAFVGRHGGRRLHLLQRPGRPLLGPVAGGDDAERGGGEARGDKVLFFPDQHLGRNTGFQLGYGESDMRGLEPPPRPRRPGGGRRQGGHPACCGRATARSTSASGPSTSPPSGPSTPAASSSSTPSAPTTWSRWPTRWAPPTPSSAPWRRAPAGSVIGVGTEIHLVKRLDDEHPDKTVVSLDPARLPLLDHVPDRRPPSGLGAREPGRAAMVVNRITVDEDTAADARVALERMLAIT